MQKIEQKGRFFWPFHAKPNARLEQDKPPVIRFQEMHNRPLPIVQREGTYWPEGGQIVTQVFLRSLIGYPLEMGWSIVGDHDDARDGNVAMEQWFPHLRLGLEFRFQERQV